jgi:hydroxymethylbilane synthase
VTATRTLRAATRGSELALWQTHHVAALLAEAHPGLVVEPVVVQTQGDVILDRPIWEIGGKGVFVKEVQAAVLDGRADLAVHSAKDLPSVTVDGLVLGAVPARGDERDALVGRSLATLGPGARIATGSVRRRSQLAHLRPDLTFTSLRGNIATRLSKVGTDGIDAIVVAAAALVRLDLIDQVAEVLDPTVLVPQVGQGALAIECRADDASTRGLLAAIEHDDSRRAVDAERGFLAELGGDCDLPAGAYARVPPEGAPLDLEGLLASLDGHVVLRHRRSQESGESPEQLGRAVARHLLDEAGGSALLAEPAR